MLEKKSKKSTGNLKNAELIIYIASALTEKPSYGITLLGKSLYLIDCMSYLKTGQPISDFEYIKQDFGPTPESSKFLSTIEKLEEDNELKKIEVAYFGKTQKKYLATRSAKIDVFNKVEISIMDEVLKSIANLSASELSEYTHTLISWNVAKKKEILPLYTFLLTSKEPSKKDYEWANKALKNFEKSKKIYEA